MKYLKKFNEINSSNFLRGGNVSFSTDSSLSQGVSSTNVAGSGGKDQSKDGPTSFGPDTEKADKVIDDLKGEKIKRKRKRKKLFRDHPGNTDNQPN